MLGEQNYLYLGCKCLIHGIVLYSFKLLTPKFAKVVHERHQNVILCGNLLISKPPPLFIMAIQLHA